MIATPNTGVEDFFTPGNPEGWLIPVDDVESLIKVLYEAKSDRKSTRERGLKGAQRAINGFSLEDYDRRARENFAKVMVAASL
ncbi:MAG: glycosyltransferase [Blastochloris sp.]|nr:glycosyltransferase [Blastochloris sp.]